MDHTPSDKPVDFHPRPESEESFTLKLFLKLNQEYADKPVIAQPRSYDPQSRQEYASQRAAMLDERIGIKGRRILEVGCGKGEVSYALARDFDCEVIGVDLASDPAWHEYSHPNLTYLATDISRQDDLKPGEFDRVVSLVVWEHVQHPFSALRACTKLLKTDGLMYLRANLYRSAVASHLYRDVLFPWPHLLFSDEVFEAFYRSRDEEPQCPWWLNRLTYADYHRYFELLGFIVEKERLSIRSLDDDFYQRFEHVLNHYSRFDLALDFFDVILSLDPNTDPEALNAARPHRREVIDQFNHGVGLVDENCPALRRLKEQWPEGIKPLDGTNALDQTGRLLETRPYRLARRLARRPRGMSFWLTLPWHLLKIAIGI